MNSSEQSEAGSPIGIRSESDVTPTAASVLMPEVFPVDALREKLKTLPAAEIPIVHRFTPGLYVRQATLPVGSVTVTKVHKTEHPFVMIKGRCSVLLNDGTVQQLSAPHVGVTQPGTRRVIYAREEVVWLTFHPTELTDPEAIEAQIIEKRNYGRDGDGQLVALDAETVRRLTE